MYPLWNLLKFVAGLLYRWATATGAHPWGCHCEKCMAEYNAVINERMRRYRAEKAKEKKGSVSDADLLSALVNLGYRAREAQWAVGQLGSEGSFQERFKRALQFLKATRGER